MRYFRVSLAVGIFPFLTGCPSPVEPLKIVKSCPPTATNNDVICDITTNTTGHYVFTFGYKVGKDSNNPGKEAWVDMATFVGPRSALPDKLQVCSAYDKKAIDNYTRLEAICRMDMEKDRPYAFRARVHTENSAGVWIDFDVKPQK